MNNHWKEWTLSLTRSPQVTVANGNCTLMGRAHFSKLGTRSDTAMLTSCSHGFFYRAICNPAAAENPASQRYDTTERIIEVVRMWATSGHPYKGPQSQISLRSPNDIKNVLVHPREFGAASQDALANTLGIMGMSSGKTEAVRQTQIPSVSLLAENNYPKVWKLRNCLSFGDGLSHTALSFSVSLIRTIC